MSLEEGGQGRQLAALKKIKKTAKESLKVMIESWSPHGTRFNKLTFNNEVGYGWVVIITTNTQLE